MVDPICPWCGEPVLPSDWTVTSAWGNEYHEDCWHEYRLEMSESGLDDD